MRRIWICAALLAALGGLGWWNQRQMEGICGELTQSLTLANAQAEAGDWTQAEKNTALALERWESCKGYLTAVQRHDYADEITAGLREALMLLRWGEGAEYADVNQRTLAALEKLGEAERLTWGNLL